MKTRILKSEGFYRAQVKTFLFWRDLTSDGYREQIGDGPCCHSYHTAKHAIRKFLENEERFRKPRGPWSVIEKHTS